MNLLELATVVQCKQSPIIILRPLTQWTLRTGKKVDSLVEINTFEWPKAPRDKNIVGSRWLFNMKNKPDGSYEYKARFMAQSYSQIYGKGYSVTFASMKNMASIRLQLQIADYYGLLNHHIDIQSAYLNAP